MDAVKDRDSLCVGGLNWAKDFPAAEGLCLPFELLLGPVVRGSYALEATL